jgi:SNF2 family DNA or RNA helicase
MGLTLTAADHIFIMDPWWNPSVEEQASDRAHRIGQVNPVLVHRLIAQDTIEEQILELQKSKTELATQVLEGTLGANSLSREDLLSLLKEI